MTADDYDPPTPPLPAESRGLRRIVASAALLAAAISIYLVAASLSASGRPLGCGVGSGCDQVLSSPWSKVLGVPVGVPAAAIYLLLATTTCLSMTAARCSRRWSRVTWIAAGAIISAVSWFVGLQAIEIRSFCPWCLAAHGLGTLAAIAALLHEVLGGRFRPGAFVLGMLLAGLLAMCQVLWPASGPAPATLNATELTDLEELFQRQLDRAPRLGTATSRAPLGLLFDYCCPHCRQTHQLLEQLRQQHPDQLSLLLLPVPLNAACNSHVDETEPRFESACDLARLSLVVWHAQPARFDEFDAWLFASEQPRGADEARRRVLEWMTAEELDTLLADVAIESQLQANVRAFHASGVTSLPVLVAPGEGGVSGRATDLDSLKQLLQSDLGWSPQ